jgi:glutamate-ammonia-ligase adenylyltransferase
MARAGFVDGRRALALFEELGFDDPEAVDGLVPALGGVADPDLALLGLVRLRESFQEDDRLDGAELLARLRTGGQERDRLLAVLGASSALTDHLVHHPEHWTAVTDARASSARGRREAIKGAVADRSGRTAYDALRIAYRRELLGIAALDLTSADPLSDLPVVAEALADLASAALGAALAIAREELGAAAQACRIAVIGMGKCGGLELNYISDVDVIFVAEPVDGADEDTALAAATQLATATMRACSASTGEGSLWTVDANLRPEGKNGPLVRTVASHQQYYEKWAKTWEFQALLKARTVAGDPALGQAYLEAVQPLVWQASSRDHFVEDVQAMRRRVEAHVPPGEVRRQLKLGPGGLRDVEFSVQLLQLVHGRADETLRSGTTLEALDALSQGGYVGRDDAAVLDGAYRLLRVLEHRIQLFRLRRTHLMPTSDADLRRLGRALGHRAEPATEITARWRQQAREVRRLHERLFYRPLLSAAAKLTTPEARLTPAAAQERLSALGFRDPAGALRHLESLTAGVSRRAAIERTLLPVMLGWFADEADPDAGLLSFRRISDSLGTTHWYLKMLRDEGGAAERLAHVLASSRYAADLLLRAPESVKLLGDAAELVPRSREAALRTMRSAMTRKGDRDEAMTAARVVRRQELFRIAVADLVDAIDLSGVGGALTDLTAAILQAALELATGHVEGEQGESLATRLLIVGMGRRGGGEMGYSSDADVMFVHDPVDAGEEAAKRATTQATAVVQELRRLLGGAGPDPQLVVDADLRPEGKAGPLVRSLDSYRAYYARWSAGWEAQALLRAAPVAGDGGLARRVLPPIHPLRWPQGGIPPWAVRKIRTLKARMEAERIPRGGDPKTHFKLGRGGLSDVEWTVQLLQLQHAPRVEGLRCTGTLEALDAAVEAGLIGAEHATTLARAWTLASEARNASVLWRGRPVDSIPSDLRDADGVGRIIGCEPGTGWQLADTYRRVARLARHVVDEEFYGGS